MTTKTQKIRVGAFIAVTAALGAVVLMVWGGLRFWEGHDHYRVRFDNSVMGLDTGAMVYLDGIRVGKVTGIEVAHDDLRKVDVTISVAEGTPVRADTKAALQYAGITGLKVIDLEGGTLAAARLAEGGIIPAAESVLDKLQKQAEGLVDQSAQVMQRANKIVDNLVAVTDPARFAVIDQILGQARVAVNDLGATSATVRAMVGENRVALRESIGAIHDTAQSASEMMDGQVAQFAANANDLVSQIKSIVQSNEPSLRSAMFDLRQASRSFKELARDVKERPSRLLFSSAPADRVLP